MIRAVQTVLVMKDLVDPFLPFKANDPDGLDPGLGSGNTFRVEWLDAHTFREEIQLHCLCDG